MDNHDNAAVDVEPANVVLVKKRKNLTGDEKRAVLIFLKDVTHGATVLSKEARELTCEFFGIGETVVKAIWKASKNEDHLSPEELLKSLSPNRKGNCGKKRKTLPLDDIQDLQPNKRRTVRALSKSIGWSKSTVQDHIQKGELKWHSSALKPSHTPANQLQRLEHCIAMICPETVFDDTDPTFLSFYNHIHLDEKWFNLYEDGQRYLLAPGEDPVHRTCKHKKFIGKIMFLSAVGRPRFNAETGECTFNGKIGIWPFVKEVPAERRSANRERGTLELKLVNVTRESYREMLLMKVLPTFIDNFPDLATETVWQHDNAKPHIGPNDPTFVQAIRAEGANVKLFFQPPNSPDLNVNDLGFFRALDAERLEENSRNLRELVNNVTEAFWNFDPVQLNKIWLTYQQCMIEIMRCEGKNTYKLPHMKKDQLIRQNRLPTSLRIPHDLYASTLALIEGRAVGV